MVTSRQFTRPNRRTTVLARRGLSLERLEPRCCRAVADVATVFPGEITVVTTPGSEAESFVVSVHVKPTTILPDIDVLFLVDASDSFSNDVFAARTAIRSIQDALDGTANSVRIGLATFQDYPRAPFGSPADSPYRLLQSLDADFQKTFSAFDAIDFGNGQSGGDFREGQYAALLAAVGAGWDANRDGDFADTMEGDVPPSDVGFRPEAVRLIVVMTDACFHGSASMELCLGERPLLGDANFDESVDVKDFEILKSHFSTRLVRDDSAAVKWTAGDFSGDGDVDIEDFSLLKRNFGTRYPGPRAVDALPIIGNSGILVAGAHSVSGGIVDLDLLAEATGALTADGDPLVFNLSVDFLRMGQVIETSLVKEETEISLGVVSDEYSFIREITPVGDSTVPLLTGGTAVFRVTVDATKAPAIADDPYQALLRAFADASEALGDVDVTFIQSGLHVDPALVSEGGLVTLRGTFSDAGLVDSHTVEIDWGEGGAPSILTLDPGARSFTVTHVYADDHPTGTPSDIATIRVTVRDDDGGIVTGQTTVTVENLPPETLSLMVDPALVSEGGLVTLLGTFADGGLVDSHTVEIDWGEGGAPSILTLDPGARSFTVTHVYADDHPTGTPSDIATIRVTVRDDDGGTVTGQTTVTVENLPPETLSLMVDPALVSEGGLVTLRGTFADGGLVDSHTVEIDWGEGGAPSILTLDPGARSFTVTHVYADDHPTGTASDVQTIRVTVRDDDGGTVTGQTTVTVENLPPETLSLMVDPALVSEGGLVTLRGTFSDAGLADRHTVEIDWGEGGAPSILTLDPGARSFTVTHVYADDHPTGTPSDIATIRVTVRDDDGGTVTGQTTVTVENLPPIISTLPPLVTPPSIIPTPFRPVISLPPSIPPQTPIARSVPSAFISHATGYSSDLSGSGLPSSPWNTAVFSVAPGAAVIEQHVPGKEVVAMLSAADTVMSSYSDAQDVPLARKPRGNSDLAYLELPAMAGLPASPRFPWGWCLNAAAAALSSASAATWLLIRNRRRRDLAKRWEWLTSTKSGSPFIQEELDTTPDKSKEFTERN